MVEAAHNSYSAAIYIIIRPPPSMGGGGTEGDGGCSLKWHHRYVLKEIMKAKDFLHETYLSFLTGQVLAVIFIKVQT